MSSFHIAKGVLALSLCASFCVSAVAATYSTTYTGTVADSSVPGVNDGDEYSVRLILDNGGTSALGQTWSDSALKCVVWTFGTFQFAHDLTVTGHNTAALGQVTTNALGALEGLYSRVGVLTGGVSPAAFHSNLSPAPVDLYWSAPSTVTGAVFIAGAEPGIYTDAFSDASGSISMVVADWSAVTPFTTDLGTSLRGCSPVVSATPSRVSSVPATGLPALALLGLAFAGFAARKVRAVAKSQSNRLG